ncbi:MAG: class I SAM-dependent methyltransferase [Pseudomonadota bacterium]
MIWNFWNKIVGKRFRNPLNGDGSFKTKNFKFVSSATVFTIKTTEDSVALLKDVEMLDLYEKYLPKNSDKILEIGFFEGGMPLLLADTLKSAKIVAVDYKLPSDALKRHLERAGFESRVKFFGRTMQNDGEAIRSILDSEFGDSPLDVISDDCSHEYEYTKASFEACFGYLRPGGKFFLEDWGWAHWPDDKWQSETSYFHGRPALTNLLFELIMVQASAPSIVAKIEIVSPAFAVITRGDGLGYKEKLSLQAIYKTAGRKFSIL